MFSRNSAPVLLLALASVWPVAAQNPSQQGRERPGAARANTAVSSEEAEQYAVANEYYEAGQTGTALAAYRQFLELYPASSLASKAQYRVAELLDASGNSNKAFDAYQTSSRAIRIRRSSSRRWPSKSSSRINISRANAWTFSASRASRRRASPADV